MSTSVPSADAKAVVRAIEQLSTQLRRAVDDAITGVGRAVVEASSATQADFALAPTPTDDDATTPLRLTTPCAVCTHPYNWHKAGVCQADECGCIAFARGARCVQCDSPDVRYRNYQEQPFCWPCANGEQQAPAADEDAQRTARRHSIRVLLNRLNNGLPLGSEEAQLLTRHVAAEICEANDGRKRAEQAEERLHVEPCKPPRMAVHCGGECLPIDPSDPDRHRTDCVALIDGALTVVTGTPGGPGPTLPNGSHYIAEVHVPRAATEITASHITSSGLLFYRPTTEA